MPDHIVHEKVREPDADGICYLPDHLSFPTAPLVFIGESVETGYLFRRKGPYTPAVIFYEDQ